MMLHLLQQFIAVAETHSFTKASQKVFISQPALTKNIKKLEEEFGGILIMRTNKGCSLTNFGRILYRHAKAIDNEVALLYTEMSRERLNMENHLAIAYGSLWQLRYAAEIFLAIQELTGKEIILSGKNTSTTNHAVEDLLKGECDLFFGKIPEDLNPRLIGIPLTDTRHSIFAHKHHQLFKDNDTTLHFSIDTLVQYKWIVFGTKKDINEYDIPDILKEKVKIQTLHDVNSILIVIRILQSSDAMILLPKQVGMLLRLYDIVEITNHDINFPLFHTGAIFRKEQKQDWLINTVVEIARKICQ